MTIIHSKNYSFRKNWELFIQKIIQLEKNYSNKYSFKKFENYSFKIIIHFFDKFIIAQGYLDGPDVRAQDSFTFIPLMFEQFLMVSQSGLPVSCTAAHIGLHLLHALHPGLHHLGLVHHIAIKAEALQGAGASFPCGSWARAVLHLLLGDAVSQQLVVVVVDHLPHVGACEVGDFEVAPMGTFLGKHLSINARNFAPMLVLTLIENGGFQ